MYLVARRAFHDRIGDVALLELRCGVVIEQVQCPTCGRMVYRSASGILRHTWIVRWLPARTPGASATAEHEQCPGTTYGAKP